MEKIRVNNGDKNIEVNDAGEYITLRFSDQSFPPKVFSMLDRVQERAEALKNQEAELKEKHKDDPTEYAYMQEAAALNEEIHRYIMAEVDATFGPETCRKVFGDIVPDVALFDDFFSQIMPFFEAYGKARAERVKKYSAERMGNV